MSALEHARALQRAGEARAALGAYHRALAAGASPAEVHLQLGVLHSELGERDLAISHLRRLLAIEPAHADALCMLGTVLYDGGDFAAAVQTQEEALRLRPGFAEALFNLGLAQFELGRIGAAANHIRACHAANRGAPWNDDPAARLDAPPLPQLPPEEMATNRTKIRHDAEQLQYLLAMGRLPAAFQPVLEAYRTLLAELPRTGDASRMMSFDEGRHALVARTYKRPLHVEAGEAPPGEVVNPTLDFRDLERRYADAQPNVLAVDGLVTADALERLRRFCRESTIWNDIKVGYLGAYFFDGFCCELLLRLAHELRERLPGIIRGQPLHMMWGYKCDASLTALGTHADAAAVNINFWITEDEANLDAASGGLLVHTQQAPADWGFNKFNLEPAAIERHLQAVGSEPLRFPYRANRAVIFDSDLFHASDRPRFREGYLNRRINITLLYGSRH